MDPDDHRGRKTWDSGTPTRHDETRAIFIEEGGLKTLCSSEIGPNGSCQICIHLQKGGVRGAPDGESKKGSAERDLLLPSDRSSIVCPGHDTRLKMMCAVTAKSNE